MKAPKNARLPRLSQGYRKRRVRPSKLILASRPLTERQPAPRNDVSSVRCTCAHRRGKATAMTLSEAAAAQ